MRLFDPTKRPPFGGARLCLRHVKVVKCVTLVEARMYLESVIVPVCTQAHTLDHSRSVLSSKISLVPMILPCFVHARVSGNPKKNHKRKTAKKEAQAALSQGWVEKI